MGKKKVTKQSSEEVLAEANVIESASVKAKTKSVSKKIESGRLYVNATFNNTIITVTNDEGEVITWASAGSLGFHGPRRATPFAASKVVTTLSEKLKKSGPTKINIFLKGVGAGRDSALRSLANQGFEILSIKDITPIPHNGPKPKKVRRL